MTPRFFERDLSWLAFNHRVLQEALNSSVPLLERLKFLAIFSSNLDEFYRVRVASHRTLQAVGKKTKSKYALNPEQMVETINAEVQKQQQAFGRVFRTQLVPELKDENTYLVRPADLHGSHRSWLKAHFEERIKPALKVMMVKPGKAAPFLQDRALYLAVRLLNKKGESCLSLVHLPFGGPNRFVVVPDEQRHIVVMVDELVRWCIEQLFPKQSVLDCYEVKLSRDADLYLEDEFEGAVIDKIKKSLAKRHTGTPTRFLYDEQMPPAFVKQLRKALGLKKADLVAGGRTHNFHDYFAFPAPKNAALVFEPQPALQHPQLHKKTDHFALLKQQDVLLHFPYQNYGHVINYLNQAVADDSVTEIRITLYRVARESAVCKALEKAAKKGIKVTVFDEVQARFDEESNIYWGDRLTNPGATVLYSYEELKVHTKLFLIARTEKDKSVRYAYLGTGNFNEKTASIYGDHALFTAHPEITAEVEQVFDYLADRTLQQAYKHLLVAPFGLRSGFEGLIDREIKNAKAGKPASMILKMNSLQDRDMILKLYEASNAGVKIRLIVRGICCLVPGIRNLSSNIRVTSIVDRYLEHARVFIFHNSGNEEYYIASADWMTRNLSRRVEVAFPIYDEGLRAELRQIIDTQLADNVKARRINATQSNPMVTGGSKQVRSQYATYNWLADKK